MRNGTEEGIWRHLAAAAVLGASTLIGLGCSGPPVGREGSAAAPAGVTVQATMRLPGTSLEDWVSYGDAVVVATATGERELPPGPDDEALGEGLIGREVELSVDRVLWSRAGAPQAPSTLTLLAPGWVFDGTERSEMVLDEVDRMALGGRYLIPIVRYADTGWGLLATVTPMDDAGRIDAAAAAVGADEEVPALEGDRTPSVRALPALAGHSEDEIAALLAATPPDPTAAGYAHLDPVARWNAVGVELDRAVAGAGTTTTVP